MMTVDEFTRRTGYPPEQDDLERVNCDKAGAIGHMACGWCDKHDAPRFQCGCLARAAIGADDETG